MKKLAIAIIFLFTVTTVFTGCRDKKNNDVEDVIDDVGDAVDDVADDVEDAVD
ncbi:hypothetical protein SAMN05428642_1021144 [Flaviramulus basaltis]|uniref:Entericidin EcnA/B family protein n=1 Tax=Flaviramulus basaltis TaxID=369401 RepID=A0A1K2IKQ9_9FLAO|nr:hypothetical protein [Flaviramulus basaltis]SFZ93037.1 hypothetical protein SAMN05428642_1021144 [Flaviramulus basaltis]